MQATRRDVIPFFVLACGITWLTDLPCVLACLRHVQPAPWAMMLTGLGALGPVLAALVVGAATGTLADVFGRWRTKPAWVVLALFAPLAIHLPATLIEVALGGHPEHWFYPPLKPEQIAALVMFPLGEEFGWRGLAYPRLADRYGPLAAALIVGLVWSVWHLGMKFTVQDGAPDPVEFAIFVADLALYSVVIAWVFEHAHRSMAVAIAVHAGAHLDNVYRAPETEIRLRVLRFIVLAVVAGIAARSLTRRPLTTRAPAAA